MTGLSDTQKQAFIDVLMVGMYADHDLASTEDASIRQLFDAGDFPTDYDWQRFSDASITRVRPHITSPESIRSYLTTLAGKFPDRKSRWEVYKAASAFLASDASMKPEENRFLTVLKEVLAL